MVRIPSAVAAIPKFAAAVAACCCLWLSASAQETLTNGDVLRLSEAGIDDAVIKTMIESSPSAFDTSVDALTALAEADIDSEVISAIVKVEREKEGGETARDDTSAPKLPATLVSAGLSWTHVDMPIFARSNKGTLERQESKGPHVGMTSLLHVSCEGTNKSWCRGRAEQSWPLGVSVGLGRSTAGTTTYMLV